MAWKGGFSGIGYDRVEFREWLQKQKKPVWASFIVAHETDAPYVIPPVAPRKRMANLADFFKNKKKWSGAPQLFVLHTRVFPGTPISETGVHCRGWDHISLACETEGAYTRKLHSPISGAGGEAWDTTAWVFAEVCLWMGWEANEKRIRLHHEGNTTHVCCKGIDKVWFIDKVRKAMGKGPLPKPVVFDPKAKQVNIPKPMPKQLYDVKVIQTRLVVHGYNPGPIDGVMGAETKAAIEAMQAKLGITPTGLVGPWVWEQLEKEPPAKPLPKPLPKKEITQIVAPRQPEPNPKKAMRFLQAAPPLWPRHWAAGAVAQAQRESYPDLRPWAKGDWILDGRFVKNGTQGAHPTAFGIWQLRDDRWDKYQRWAEEQNKTWEDFETQVLWCPYELKTSEKLAWKWLQRAETVEQACAAMVWYERPRGYNPAKARAAETWDDVFDVSRKCDGWEVRLGFAKALM